MNFISAKGSVDDVSILHVFNLLGYIIVLFHLIFTDPSTYDFPGILWWWKTYAHMMTRPLYITLIAVEGACAWHPLRDII